MEESMKLYDVTIPMFFKIRQPGFSEEMAKQLAVQYLFGLMSLYLGPISVDGQNVIVEEAEGEIGDGVELTYKPDDN